MNMNEMLKQAQKLQEDMENAQKELENASVEVSSAGGAVKVNISGSSQFKSFEISEDIYNEGREAIQDAVLVAAQEAIKAARKKHEEVMKNITAGLKLPNMDELDKLGSGPKRRTDSTGDSSPGFQV
jgi:hypothetical protein